MNADTLAWEKSAGSGGVALVNNAMPACLAKGWITSTMSEPVAGISSPHYLTRGAQKTRNNRQ